MALTQEKQKGPALQGDTTKKRPGATTPEPWSFKRKTMSENEAMKNESTDKRITIDRRSDAVIKGETPDVDIGGGLVEVTRGFENLHIEVDAWHTDEDEIEPGRTDRTGVFLKVTTPGDVVEQLTLATELEADRARALGRSLVEAADVADGEINE